MYSVKFLYFEWFGILRVGFIEKIVQSKGLNPDKVTKNSKLNRQSITGKSRFACNIRSDANWLSSKTHSKNLFIHVEIFLNCPLIVRICEKKSNG